MECESIARLLSKSYDDELSSEESTTLERHLRTCESCRLERILWRKYEHRMTHFYGSHRLDESFVNRMHQSVAGLTMEPPQPPRPEIAGRVNGPALQWLQPVGLAAAVLLAAMLFLFRSDPFIGQLLEGTGSLLQSGLADLVHLSEGNRPDVREGDLVWTDASQWLRLRLRGDVSLYLAERGLISFSPDNSQQRGIAQLHSGRVNLGGEGNNQQFVLNTAAGEVRGEVGQVAITARWVSLSEKDWSSSRLSQNWSEGWRAVPITRVDVTDGTAEISFTNGSAELLSGQSATLSPALDLPIVDPVRSGKPTVSVENFPNAGGAPSIRSRLLRQENAMVIETTFVGIPLQTVLSSVAEVQESRIELGAEAGSIRRSMQVTRRVGTPGETTLAAVIDFAGMTYRREMRPETTQAMDLVPEQRRSHQSVASPKLTLEVEGNSVRLLKGSGVPLSLLSRALEDSLDESVELNSADWTLGAFEIRDVPRNEMTQTLGRELQLQFSKKSRLTPYYRIEPAGEASADGRPSKILSEAQGVRGEAATTVPGDSPDGSGEAEENPDRTSPSVQEPGQRRAGGSSLPDGGDPQRILSHLQGWNSPIPASQNEFAQWMDRLAAWQLAALRLDAGSAGSHNTMAGEGEGSAQFQALDVDGDTGDGEGSSPDPFEGDWSRLTSRQLQEWSRSATPSRRFFFTSTPQNRDFLLLGFSNQGSSTAWVRVDLKEASGSTLDSIFLEVLPQSLLTAVGSEIFPSLENQKEPAYLEAEANFPVSGFEIALLDGDMFFLPGQPVSEHLRYYAPFATGATNPTPAAIEVKLVNPTDLSHQVRISMAPVEGFFLPNIREIVLEPHASKTISIPISEFFGPAASNVISGGLWFDSDQAGLVGHTWITRQSSISSEFSPVPIRGRLSTEWEFSLARPPSGDQSPELRIALVNPQPEPVTVWLAIRQGATGEAMPILQAIELPSFSTRFIALPSHGAAISGLQLLVRTSAPVTAFY